MREAVAHHVVGRLVALEARSPRAESRRTARARRRRRAAAAASTAPGTQVDRRGMRHAVAHGGCRARRHAGARVVEERQVRLQHAPAVRRRATRGAAGRRAAPSCARTRRCRTAGRVTRAAAPRRARSSGLVHQPHDGARQRVGVALRHDDARRGRRVEHVEQAVGVGRHDRLPHRQRLEHRQRRALPERRKHADVERRDDARDVAREAGEHEPIAEAERARLRFERLAQRPLADQEEPRVAAARRRPAARRRRGTSCPSTRAAA